MAFLNPIRGWHVIVIMLACIMATATVDYFYYNYHSSQQGLWIGYSDLNSVYVNGSSGMVEFWINNRGFVQLWFQVANEDNGLWSGYPLQVTEGLFANKVVWVKPNG